MWAAYPYGMQGVDNTHANRVIQRSWAYEDSLYQLVRREIGTVWKIAPKRQGKNRLGNTIQANYFSYAFCFDL